jgi:hypothetical protein
MSCSFDQDKLTDQKLSIPEEIGSKYLSIFVMSTMHTNEELASNPHFHNRIISKVTEISILYLSVKGKGKAVPLQAWTGPGVSRRLRLQISKHSAHEGGKVSPTHRPPLPPGNIPSTHFC